MKERVSARKVAKDEVVRLQELSKDCVPGSDEAVGTSKQAAYWADVYQKMSTVDTNMLIKLGFTGFVCIIGWTWNERHVADTRLTDTILRLCGIKN